MSRRQRVRVVLAVMLACSAGAVGYLGPAVNTLIWPTLYPHDVSRQGDVADMVRVNIALAGGGLVVAVLAALYVLVVWARWFIGPAERSAASATKA